MIIRNKERLLSHGNKKGREVALDVIEHAIKAVDPYDAVKKLVHVENERKLTVGDLSYDISEERDMYVVGAGKASFAIAQALDEILGERIKRGVINAKRGENGTLIHTRVRGAGHPIPDEVGLEGAKEIMDVAREARDGDLVFCAITGGASALMPLPAKGIELEDIKTTTNLLLRCGATIDEINAVRKHISAIKGGRLAMHIHPAEIINLIVVDEVAGLPWGPTVPDTTTFEEAVHVLSKYHLWEKIPGSVKKHVERGLTDRSLETPKPEDFEDLAVHNIVLASNEIACKAAKERAEKLGYDAMILSTVLEGESREAGIVLAGIAKDIEKNRRPLEPPCVLIVGGETTVKIIGEPGEGGRNQELALAASMKIDGSRRIVISSVATDGTDGPTDIAGGIVDGYTLERARGKGIDVSQNLMKHNSSYVFRQLEDAIFTGPTRTNVMDLMVLVITAISQLET